MSTEMKAFIAMANITVGGGKIQRVCCMPDELGSVYDPTQMGDPHSEIWEAITASNRAWTGGDPRGVESLFHPDVVMVAPGLASGIHGRAAMVESFVEYTRRAQTQSFEELEHRIDVFGETAIATYRYKIRYELAGEVHDETGQEVLVFVREGGRWQAVWRTQFPLH